MSRNQDFSLKSSKATLSSKLSSLRCCKSTQSCLEQKFHRCCLFLLLSSNDISRPNLVNSALYRTKLKLEQSGFEKSILRSNMPIYLGLHLDNKLNWMEHIIKKRKQIDLRYRELYWLLGRKFHLPVDNKLLLYKFLIPPIWTYCIGLWGCVCKSNTTVIQRCQSKILRATVDALRCELMIRFTKTWVFQQ